MDGPFDVVHQTAPEMAESSGSRVSFGTGFRAEEIPQASHWSMLAQWEQAGQGSIWLASVTPESAFSRVARQTLGRCDNFGRSFFFHRDAGPF